MFNLIQRKPRQTFRKMFKLLLKLKIPIKSKVDSLIRICNYKFIKRQEFLEKTEEIP